MAVRTVTLWFCLALHSSVRAADVPVSLEAQEAIRKLRVAPGLKAELFAAEPLIANPVSFDFDERGRAYVVETHRRRTSVLDIRRHMDWLDSDLSFRTVEDRAQFFRKVLQPENKNLPEQILRDQNGDGQFDYRDLEVESERIRLLEDRDGDGRAERAVTFADGFNSLVSGVAAGVLARQGKVWFACVPDLWLLRDTQGQDRADVRQPLLSGFGVHIAYGGHDMHGLILGPDGKLYFSIADRGLHVQTGGRTFALPDTGAVLRCNPDGSEFEIYATGFRNPQELAFDQFGNLWTGDNNGDGGDKARWIYVLEGSDGGWHIGWQHLPKLGLWNSEKLWELQGQNTAASILPPVAHVGHGPAGIAFYPGTGLPARYDHHFFMCDFPGGVRTFSLRPKGAAYEVVNVKELLWELFPVDVAFGPDGGAYVADWVEGWEKTGKGRIFRVYDPEIAQDKAVRETKKLLAEGMRDRSVRQLSRLLAHVDQRVRLEAQFELAGRGAASTNHLFHVARQDENPLARLHAVWGLGQIGRRNPDALAGLLLLTADADPEVRAQAARMLGEGRYASAFEPLALLLRDPSPRVRLFAAMGIGKLGRPEATEPVFMMIRDNADRDPYLRHAGVMALVWLNDINALIVAAKDHSASVRLASLLAMRRLGRPEVAMFLYDHEPALALEAARAIYDVPIESGLTQLANLSAKVDLPEPVLRRALHAHFRLGNLENALSLGEFAAKTNAAPHLRAEALELLGSWSIPPGRDGLLGLWRPLPQREARAAVIALRSELPGLLRSPAELVAEKAIQTAGRLQITSAGLVLAELAASAKLRPALRLEALKALAASKDPRLAESVVSLLGDPSELLRKEAHRLQALLNPDDALTQVVSMLEKGTMGEKQTALGIMGAMDNPVADRVLAAWLGLLQEGRVPKELQLDLLEAAGKRSAPAVQEKLQSLEHARPAGDPLAPYRAALQGGDAEAGRKIFEERAELGCARCHKAKGQGGEVGPDLAGIGAKKTREQLLESILFPNQEITAGYENLVVSLKNGSTYSGQFKSETERELLLTSPEFGLIVLAKSQIERRTRGLSSMPEDLVQLMTKRELRDLIEFLASLQ